MGEEKKFEKNSGRKRRRVEKVTVGHWGSYCIISRREEGIMMIKMVKNEHCNFDCWRSACRIDIYRYIV